MSKFFKSPVLSLPLYMWALLFYSLIMLFVTIADGMMSYLAPLFIENHVQNQFVMGLIIASSSMVGLLCDAFFPNVFRSKKHSFFLWNTVIIALFFPAVFLFLPRMIPTFVLAMAIWGVYFEFLVFSNTYFVDAYVKVNHHGIAWGILNTFRSIGWFVAPLLAPYLADQGEHYALWTVILFLLVSLGGIILFQKILPHHKRSVEKEVVVKKYSFAHEMTVWKVFMKRLWPLYLFILSFFVVEAAFLTIGVLLTEEMRQLTFWGNFIIAAYLLPSLFTGLLVEKFATHIGKKRVAFVSGLIGGLLLFISSAIPPSFLLMVTIFVAAIFISMTYPAIMAVMQDYLSRLHQAGTEMVGLKNAAGSLGYVVGPILAGWISVQVGNMMTIGIMGLLFAIVSAINLVVVPRKVHMPQKELAALETND